jgi:ferrous iron transport protein B
MSPPAPDGATPQTLPAAGVPDAPSATVALVGPPNCGKSTLFNRLTGLRQKTANFPGVTVERHHGTVRLSSGKELELLDLPGTYSLTPRSEDERITDDLLRQGRGDRRHLSLSREHLQGA